MDLTPQRQKKTALHCAKYPAALRKTWITLPKIQPARSQSRANRLPPQPSLPLAPAENVDRVLGSLRTAVDARPHFSVPVLAGVGTALAMNASDD
jgi:hypothetical protein